MAVTQYQPYSLATERAFGALYRATIGRFLHWNDARITRKALMDLTDAELYDIGVERGDIDIIVGRL